MASLKKWNLNRELCFQHINHAALVRASYTSYNFVVFML